MASRIRYARLATERANPRSRALDLLSPRAIAALMNREDRRAVLAVDRVRSAIASAVSMIVGALRGGGRLFFVGAGTSGRLGVLEAAQCPPTFGTSTRLKAGTATKLVLNTLATASMTGLGRIYGNRMVDLEPRSAKLRERALRLIAELAGVSRGRALRAFEASGGRVRVAIVIAGNGWDAAESTRALRAAGGSLRVVLQKFRRK